MDPLRAASSLGILNAPINGGLRKSVLLVAQNTSVREWVPAPNVETDLGNVFRVCGERLEALK